MLSPYKRSSLFIAIGILTAAKAARAQEPNLCNPAAPPTPGCQLAPPGQPPIVSPQEVDAYRTKVAADYRRAHGPELYQRAWIERDARDQQAWRQRAEGARPGDIPVRFPTVEASAGFRIGQDLGRRSIGHAGPEIGLTLRFDQRFAVELPVALMQTWAGDLGHWATIATNPSLIVSTTNKNGIVYARGGPDILIPRGASGVAPNAMIGGHIGFGAIGFVASLPNDGYVGVGFDYRIALRGGVGGPESVLDAPRFGLDGLLILRIAY